MPGLRRYRWSCIKGGGKPPPPIGKSCWQDRNKRDLPPPKSPPPPARLYTHIYRKSRATLYTTWNKEGRKDRLKVGGGSHETHIFTRVYIHRRKKESEKSLYTHTDTHNVGGGEVISIVCHNGGVEAAGCRLTIGYVTFSFLSWIGRGA